MQESTQAPGQLKTPKLLTRLHKITGIKPPSHLWSHHEPRATEPKQHKRDCDKKRNSRECNHNIVTVSTLTHVTVRGDTRRFLNDAPFHRRQVINSKTTYQERQGKCLWPKFRCRRSFRDLPAVRSGFLWQQWQKDAQEKWEVKQEIKGTKRI